MIPDVREPCAGSREGHVIVSPRDVLSDQAGDSACASPFAITQHPRSNSVQSALAPKCRILKRCVPFILLSVWSAICAHAQGRFNEGPVQVTTGINLGPDPLA